MRVIGIYGKKPEASLYKPPESRPMHRPKHFKTIPSPAGLNYLRVGIIVCMCVCVCVLCVCVCVLCVCVRVRESERESVCVCESE